MREPNETARGPFVSVDMAPRPGATGRMEGYLEGVIRAVGSGRLRLEGRAISGPLTPVKSGLSRPLADRLTHRSGHVTGRTAQIPKLIVR